MLKVVKLILRKVISFFLDSIFVFVILVSCLWCRIFKKRTKIGLGPEPLINNVYHKKALESYGYEAETFVSHTYFITNNFDKRFDKIFSGRLLNLVAPYFIFIYTVINYKILYLYFNGSSLALSSSRLSFLEPLFYKIAGVRTVLMPYGGDVANMLFAKELKYKNALCKDYPLFRKAKRRIEKQVDLWSKYGDTIISGCDWVDYMHGWDRLCLAHFSIDLDHFSTVPCTKRSILKILHAPNHRNIKGTRHIVAAVKKLEKEGLPIELQLLEKVSNDEVLEAIKGADLIIDQLIIGWYAMFALESLACGKPVMTYIRQDLVDLYLEEGVLEDEKDLPFINVTTSNIEKNLREILNDLNILHQSASKSRKFVEKYHSLKKIGEMFDQINKNLLNSNE